MNKTLGERLKYALDIRHIKQVDFARSVGITPATLNRYIKDERQPNAEYIIIICKSLGISSDWLLGILD